MSTHNFQAYTRLLATLVFTAAASSLAACDRGADDSGNGLAPEESAEHAAENSSSAGSVREPDCVVDVVESQLTGVLLTGDVGGCSVFLPDEWNVEGMTVAIAADSATNSIALERKLENGETLYASEGEVELSVANGRLVGVVRGIDSNEPTVGALHVRVDVEVP